MEGFSGVPNSAWRALAFEGVGIAAVGLWALARSYCGDQATDGNIPASFPRKVGATTAQVRALVAAGLWTTTAKGWLDPTFLDVNATAEQRAVTRERTRVRVEAWRAKSGTCDNGNAVTNGASNGVGNAVGTMDHRVQITDTDHRSPEREPPPCPPGGGSAREFALAATTSTKAKREPKRSGTRTAMDPEFVPTPANAELATSLGLDADDERRKFLLHHAKHGNMFVSWPAAFASWLLKAREFAPRANGNGGGPVLQKSAAEYDGSTFDRLPWVVRAKAEAEAAEAEASERKAQANV